MDEEKNKKDIEVVHGIGNLDISPVFDNLTSAKPKMQNEKPKNIVIPQVKKVVKEQESDEEKKDVGNDTDTENENITEDVDIEVSNDTLEDEESIDTQTTDEENSDDSELLEGEQIEFDDFDDNTQE